jgi:hypothetical protein
VVPDQFDCRELLYQEFPTKMRWDTKHRPWVRRKNKFSTIGRMYFAGPSAVERFYMRMLLTVKRGPASYEDLRTVNGILHGTYKLACIALGLLDSDDYWHECLLQGASWQSAPQLRFLLAIILVHCHLAEPLKLWADHWEELLDDSAYQLRTNHTIAEPTDDQIQSFALCHLHDTLCHEHNSDLPAHNLPTPTHEYSVYANIENLLIADERAYDVNVLRATVERDSALLNADQHLMHCLALLKLEMDVSTPLMAMAERGKTFTVNLTLAQARANGYIAIAVASSGISSTRCWYNGAFAIQNSYPHSCGINM